MKKILITGGIKSGKSRHALSLAEKFTGQKIFVATAEPFDDEMRKKIARHKEERAGNFLTIEEPLYLSNALKNTMNEHKLVVIDCLTLWMNNLLYHFRDDKAKVCSEIEGFCGILKKYPAAVIMVTNETGGGVMPDNPLSREFCDELGKLNQTVAGICNDVILMVAGIPQKIK